MYELVISLPVRYADTMLKQPASRGARSCYGPRAAD